MRGGSCNALNDRSDHGQINNQTKWTPKSPGITFSHLVLVFGYMHDEGLEVDAASLPDVEILLQTAAPYWCVNSLVFNHINTHAKQSCNIQA